MKGLGEAVRGETKMVVLLYEHTIEYSR